MNTLKKLSALAVMSIAISACNSSTPPPATAITGTWSVESITEKSITNNLVELTFDKTIVSGNTGCNNISSSYSIDNNTLTIAPLATTRKMCLPVLMEQEAQVLKALNKIKRFQLQNDQLSLYDQQGNLQISAKRKVNNENVK